MNKVRIAIVSYPTQCNSSTFLTIFNLNFHWFQLKLPISNAQIQQTSACNTAPRDALKSCWLYGLKNKAKQHKAAHFVRIQSKQEQTAPRCTWQFGKEAQTAELSHRLLLPWPQSELLGQCWEKQTASKPAWNQVLLPSKLTDNLWSKNWIHRCIQTCCLHVNFDAMWKEMKQPPLYSWASFLFGQTLEITAILVSELQKLEESDIFFLFSVFYHKDFLFM